MKKKGIFKSFILIMLCLSVAACGKSANDNSSTDTKQSDEETTTNKDDSFVAIDTFIEKFNKISNLKINGYEAFDVQDKNNGYYRTEFRLTSYTNAEGVVCDINGKKLLLVDDKKYNNNELRMYYLPGIDDEDAEEVSWATLNIIDPSISRETVVDYFVMLRDGYDGRRLSPLGSDKLDGGLFLKNELMLDVKWDN